MPENVVKIESLAYQGGGVAHLENGKTAFVRKAAPGDVVQIRIIQDKQAFCEAEIEQLIEAGPERVEPACPLAASCGGCSWLHVGYKAQLLAKRAAVADALARIAKLSPEEVQNVVADVRESPKQLGYRNKIELTCSRDELGRLVLGYQGGQDGNPVPVTSCPLAHQPIADAPRKLQGALRYLEGNGDLGLFRVGLRHSARTNSCEIALWTRPGAFPRAAAAKTIGSAVDATSIVRVIAEPGKQRKVKQVEVLDGAGSWTERLSHLPYRVSAPSFFQVNTDQAEVLQDLVLKSLGGAAGGIVADLYAGVGTFTLPLAKTAQTLFAVESAGPAVRDLRRNTGACQGDIEVIGGDSMREIAAMGKLDALVVDPPRAGLGKEMPARIAASGAEAMAYVSCNPTTFSRDVARLREYGYVLERAVPVDLFPQTYHVEVVSRFARG